MPAADTSMSGAPKNSLARTAHSSQRAAIGEVAGQARRTSAGAFDFAPQFLELRLAAGDQHHIRARIR